MADFFLFFVSLGINDAEQDYMLFLNKEENKTIISSPFIISIALKCVLALQ